MKKAIFLGAVCSDKVFYDILNKTTQYKPNIAGQRHERMLVKGLHQAGLNIESLSMLPTTVKPYYKRTYTKYCNEIFEDVKISYIVDINIKFIKQLIRSIVIFFFLFNWLFKNKKNDRFIILGSVYPPAAFSVLLLKNFFSFTSIAYISDISEFRYEEDIVKSKSLIRSYLLRIFKSLSIYYDNKFDAYIFISKYMSDIINTRNKPFIINECLIEMNIGQLQNTLEGKSTPPAIMYAGGIFIKYGIGLLIDSMKFINNTVELWIFGDGSDIDFVIESTKKDPRIKFYGVVPHSELMPYQAKATLMINTRPSNQGFTKYSFPSKTVEYLASGTQFISTKIESIPPDYHQHIIFIDEENPKGIAKTITHALGIDRELLHKKGMEARIFALENKNYITKTKNIFEFINNLSNREL